MGGYFFSDRTDKVTEPITEFTVECVRLFVILGWDPGITPNQIPLNFKHRLTYENYLGAAASRNCPVGGLLPG